MNTKYLNKIRERRAARTRARVRGTAAIPRLSVFRSNKFIYAQLIDDESKKTLAHASSLGGKSKEKTKEAETVGGELAKKAKELGINTAVFDRGRYKFHGRLKSLCEAARKAGLKI